MPLTLNIVGAGRLGRCLGRLLAALPGTEVRAVVTAHPDSAAQAVAFIGAGHALSRISDLGRLADPGRIDNCSRNSEPGHDVDQRPATLWLLTPPDSALAPLAAELATAGLLRPGDVVCHCSGALPSSLLAPLRAKGAAVASVHPLKSFADPAAAVASFAGTWCTAEGDAAALQRLQPLFEGLGARVVRIEAAGKALYHAAAVLMCNDLVALLEAGLRSAEAAGLARGAALEMFEPLVRETLDNVFRLGTVRALTGPVARGDAVVLSQQRAALEALDPRLAEAYRALAVVALDLARAQGAAPSALAAVRAAVKKIQ